MTAPKTDCAVGCWRVGRSGVDRWGCARRVGLQIARGIGSDNAERWARARELQRAFPHADHEDRVLVD